MLNISNYYYLYTMLRAQGITKMKCQLFNRGLLSPPWSTTCLFPFCNHFSNQTETHEMNEATNDAAHYILLSTNFVNTSTSNGRINFCLFLFVRFGLHGRDWDLMPNDTFKIRYCVINWCDKMNDAFVSHFCSFSINSMLTMAAPIDIYIHFPSTRIYQTNMRGKENMKCVSVKQR